QEGLIFRHVLRLILLLGEFSQATPPGMEAAAWRGELRDLADRLTACCREVDPTSTEHMLAHAADMDIIVREPRPGRNPPAAGPSAASAPLDKPTDTETIGEETEIAEEFGAGIMDSE